MFVHYDISKRLGIDLQERYRSRLRLTADPTLYSAGGVASVAYTNATLAYSISRAEEEFNIYLNVQNVFNKQPPPAPSPTNTIFPGIVPLYVAGDDVAGRYFTLGLRARF